jgi:hypothetical protein
LSELERLRQAPKRRSGTELVRALRRVDDIARFRLGRVRIDKVPVRRMKTLAKYGAGSKAAPAYRVRWRLAGRRVAQNQPTATAWMPTTARAEVVGGGHVRRV